MKSAWGLASQSELIEGHTFFVEKKFILPNFHAK